MANEDILKEVAVETTKEIAQDVYEDGLQPAMKNTGGILGTITGFFNHFVLYPLKKVNIIYEKKAIAFERKMEEKYCKIPEECRVEPQLHIVGPAMDSLKYNIMEDDIAELYSNLLLSNMDCRLQNYCAPAFVRIIEQLSPIDAQVFKAIADKIVEPNEEKPWLKGVYIATVKDFPAFNSLHKEIILPTYMLSDINLTIDKFDLSASVINLERLGLISFSFTDILAEKTKQITEEIEKTRKATSRSMPSHVSLHNTNESLGRNCIYKANQTDDSYYFELDQIGIIALNDFAKNFARICFG